MEEKPDIAKIKLLIYMKVKIRQVEHMNNILEDDYAKGKIDEIEYDKRRYYLGGQQNILEDLLKVAEVD